MRARMLDRIANLSAELDHGLMHLGFDLFFEQDLAAFENLLNMRLQLARLRIDNRELFFNAESISVLLLAHRSHKSLSKHVACHPTDRLLRRRGEFSAH